MLEIIYRKSLMKINHVWFFDERYTYKDLKKADIYFFHGIKTAINDKKTLRFTEQHTLINDLTVQENDLWKGISGSHRNEIRRCKRDGVEVKIYSPKDILQNRELIDKFQVMYHRMFASKGIQNVFNRPLFMHYAKENAIVVSVAYFADEPVVFHSYIVDGIHSRFWYSCSDFRNESDQARQIGRANKFLHWSDFINFKAMGVEVYDWGGVNFDDPEIRGISEFKQSFGGHEMVHYDALVASNGVLGLLGRCVLKRLKT